MIINIDDFRLVRLKKYKNGPILAVYSKTIQPKMFGFKEFKIQSGMKGVVLKKKSLFGKFLFELTPFEISNQLLVER